MATDDDNDARIGFTVTVIDGPQETANDPQYVSLVRDTERPYIALLMTESLDPAKKTHFEFEFGNMEDVATADFMNRILHQISDPETKLTVAEESEE